MIADWLIEYNFKWPLFAVPELTRYFGGRRETTGVDWELVIRRMRMNLKMFSLYDSKVGAYMAPFFARSTAEAVRDFSAQANRPDSKLYVHGEDIILFEIGEFDDQTGVIAPVGHKSLGKAIDYRRFDPTSIRQE